MLSLDSIPLSLYFNISHEMLFVKIAFYYFSINTNK